MKKWILIAVLLCITVSAVVLIAGANSYSPVLQANWGFSLPAKARCAEVYKTDSGPSFHGDGLRYHVFSYRYEDYIDLMFAWADADQRATIYHGSYTDAAEDWLDRLGVPAERRPDYENCAYWYSAQEDHSEIIVFWDNDANRLYIIESFL